MAFFMACLMLGGALCGALIISTQGTVQATDILNDVNQKIGYVSVTGSATIHSDPDQVIIMLEISTLNMKATLAKNQAATVLNQVLTALRNLGLTNNDMQTTSYQIRPEFKYENSINVFKGYRVVCSIKVTLKNMDKAGRIIDDSVDAGALVKSISFELSPEKQKTVKRQALAQAAVDAREKAEIVCSALGYRVGQATSISIKADYQPYYAYEDSLYENSASQYAPPTEIIPGDVTVTASVNVVFDTL